MKNSKRIAAAIVIFITLVCVSCRIGASSKESIVLDNTVKDLHGDAISLARYKGTVILIVNIASGCVLTPQLTGLQNLYERYRDCGFTILGFPSDSFGQEKLTDEEIAVFYRDVFPVDFPVFQKIDVKGPDQHPLYKMLTDSSTNTHFPGVIRWNFEKFLIGRDGSIIERFAPEITPADSQFAAVLDSVIHASRLVRQ